MAFSFWDSFYWIQLFYPQGDPLVVVPGPKNIFYVKSIFFIYWWKKNYIIYSFFVKKIPLITLHLRKAYNSFYRFACSFCTSLVHRDYYEALWHLYNLLYKKEPTTMVRSFNKNKCDQSNQGSFYQKTAFWNKKRWKTATDMGRKCGERPANAECYRNWMQLTCDKRKWGPILDQTLSTKASSRAFTTTPFWGVNFWYLSDDCSQQRKRRHRLSLFSSKLNKLWCI